MPGPDASKSESLPEAGAGLRGVRLVGMFTLASRLLGMARDVVMAGTFGAGPVMDAFAVAFRIPNLARRLFGEGAQTSAFLPAFVRTQEHDGPAAARELAGGMFLALGALLVAMVMAAEIGLLLLYWLVPLSEDAALLVELLMWLLPYLIFICLAAQQSAVLHGLRRFGWPALLPVVMNLVWLAAIPIAFAITSDAVGRIRWLCGAILLGGVVQLGLPILVLRRAGFPLFAWNSDVRQRVGDVFRAMTPVLLGVTVTQINTVFDSLLAWLLAPGGEGEGAGLSALWEWLPELPNGTASALYFGQRLYQFPLGLIGVGLGTVLFPQMTRFAERKEWAGLNRALTDGLKLTISIGVPAGVGLMLLAEQTTRLLFEHGAFSPEAGRLTSRMMEAYSVGVPAFIGLLIVQRGYYAVGDRLTPLWHGLVAMGVNLVLDFALLFPLGATGLAWATSLSACVQVGLSTWVLQRYIGPLPWRVLGRVSWQTAIACGTMALACRLSAPAPADDLLSRLRATLLPLTVGVATYLLTARLVGLKEPGDLIFRGTLDRA